MVVDLIFLLSDYFRPVVDFQEIMRADGAALGELEQNIRQVCANCFIQTCDEATVKMYESRFSIIASPGETLDFRRQRILQKYNTIVPFSIGFLKMRLTELFGNEYTLSVDPVNSKLIISVTSSRYGAVDLLYDLLWDVVPAHMEITANQQVTSYVTGNLYTAEVLASAYVQTI